MKTNSYKPSLIDILRVRRREKLFKFCSLAALILMAGWGLSFFSSTQVSPQEPISSDRLDSLSSPDFTAVFQKFNPPLQTGSTQDDNVAPPQGIALGYPDRAQGELRHNQTVFQSMENAGVDPGSIQRVVNSLDELFDFRRAQTGDQWEVRMDEEGHVVSFRYVASPEEIYETLQDETGSYLSERIVVPITSTVVSVGGSVITTLTAAIEETGERDLLANMIMQVFQWDLDFSRDTRPGDTFRCLAEKVLIDGEFLRYDRILAVEYNNGQNTLRSYVHTDETGQNNYYFSDGTAVQRRFLKAPLNYRRISSTFSLRRFHPVLRIYRPHYGVDYAAVTGTPIWAIGNGRVDFAGERGDNGIMVVLEHAGHYESSYSHLSDIASGLRRGDRVQQGDIIGFVGNTGMSTGPHLHFGMKYRGEHVDPLGIDSPRAESLTGNQLALFEQQVAEWSEQLSAISLVPVDLAMLPAQEEEEAFEDLPSDFGIVDFETE